MQNGDINVSIESLNISLTMVETVNETVDMEFRKYNTMTEMALEEVSSKISFVQDEIDSLYCTIRYANKDDNLSYYYEQIRIYQLKLDKLLEIYKTFQIYCNDFTDNVTSLRSLVFNTSDEATTFLNQKREVVTAYLEHVNQTPKNGERGQWNGVRGESKYLQSDKEIQAILNKYGLNGIKYKNGTPDFSKVSESTVKINNMTDNRRDKGGNFEQCDHQCAKQWNETSKYGKTDWTARDCANWWKKNKYTWHERNDLKTCDLVPTKINDYFGHFGGVGEYNKTNPKRGVFDE